MRTVQRLWQVQFGLAQIRLQEEKLRNEATKSFVYKLSRTGFELPQEIL